VPFAYKLTLVYLAIVYFGQKWMAKRKAFDSPSMNRVLATWNFAFSIFSGYSAYCLLPELVNTIKNRGFVGQLFLLDQSIHNPFLGSYCHNGDYYEGWLICLHRFVFK